MKTIKRYEKNDLSEEDTLELLNEIKTDPAMAQLREQFEDQRRLYTEWPNYRLRDLIKKTIKNMQKRVETVEKASLFKPAFSRHREK